ncbi:MAG: hypothetical protein M3O86_02500 [Actinomycetota bacterium]|nr:hypothetical protein [Actinomycetota bacterium]
MRRPPRPRLDIEALFRAHQRDVFVYLLSVCQDRSLAEDLAQEIFLRAYRHALTYRGDASAKTWLLTIARLTPGSISG